MTKHGCEKCKKKFTTKSNLTRHERNCTNGSKTKKKQVFKCKYCKGDFTRKDSLDKHIRMKRCKKYKKYLKNKNNGNNNDLINTKINKMINSTYNVNKNQNVYNINLVLFSKDGINNISLNELKNILGSKDNLVRALIETVNFNPDKPEHHNIFYPDTKSSYGEVYENKTWVKKKIDEILDTLVDSKIEDLSDILNDMGEFLNEKTINRIKETIENFDYRKPNARKKLKTYLKPILYNNKDMILKTRQTGENSGI